METVVGTRMIRKSNGLELVVQHRVFSRNARAAAQDRTHTAGNPETHTYNVQRSRNLKKKRERKTCSNYKYAYKEVNTNKNHE